MKVVRGRSLSLFAVFSLLSLSACMGTDYGGSKDFHETQAKAEETRSLDHEPITRLAFVHKNDENKSPEIVIDYGSADSLSAIETASGDEDNSEDKEDSAHSGVNESNNSTSTDSDISPSSN